MDTKVVSTNNAASVQVMGLKVENGPSGYDTDDMAHHYYLQKSHLGRFTSGSIGPKVLKSRDFQIWLTSVSCVDVFL